MAGKTPLWIAVFLLIGWGFAAASRRPAHSPPPDTRGSDVQLYRAVTARVSAGDSYYRVLADELPARQYATWPVFNWRMPTLTWLNAISPPLFWGRVLFSTVGAIAIGAWSLVVWRSIPRAAIGGLIVIALTSLPLLVNSASVVLYEPWAGVLIAASLACWGLGWTKGSVALGAAALMIRELALPYVCIMAGLAWWEGQKREALAWSAAAGVFAAGWAWHVSRVLNAMPAEPLENTWLAFGGWTFVLNASQATPILTVLPASWDNWILAVVIPVLWAGCWYWADGVGRRLAVVLVGYFALFTIVGRPDNWYWGFVIAPLIPLGAFGYFFGRKPGKTAVLPENETPGGAAQIHRRPRQ